MSFWVRLFDIDNVNACLSVLQLSVNFHERNDCSDKRNNYCNYSLTLYTRQKGMEYCYCRDYRQLWTSFCFLSARDIYTEICNLQSPMFLQKLVSRKHYLVFFEFIFLPMFGLVLIMSDYFLDYIKNVAVLC